MEEAGEEAAVVLERLERYPLRDVVRRVQHPDRSISLPYLRLVFFVPPWAMKNGSVQEARGNCVRCVCVLRGERGSGSHLKRGGNAMQCNGSRGVKNGGRGKRKKEGSK